MYIFLLHILVSFVSTAGGETLNDITDISTTGLLNNQDAVSEIFIIGLWKRLIFFVTEILNLIELHHTSRSIHYPIRHAMVKKIIGCRSQAICKHFTLIMKYVLPALAPARPTAQCLYSRLATTKINTLRPRQSGCHFPDHIFEYTFMKENVWISLKISLKLVRKVEINTIPSLF